VDILLYLCTSFIEYIVFATHHINANTSMLSSLILPRTATALTPVLKLVTFTPNRGRHTPNRGRCTPYYSGSATPLGYENGGQRTPNLPQII
jgi:hypothetical protein